MRVFKNKAFNRFARHEGITDEDLCGAVRDVERGLVHCDYQGGVINQRIARPNEGKSGGFRTIVLYRLGERAFFVYGFAKSAQDNISKSEVKGFKDLASLFLGYSDKDIEVAVQAEVLIEVKYEENV